MKEMEKRREGRELMKERASQKCCETRVRRTTGLPGNTALLRGGHERESRGRGGDRREGGKGEDGEEGEDRSRDEREGRDGGTEH